MFQNNVMFQKPLTGKKQETWTWGSEGVSCVMKTVQSTLKNIKLMWAAEKRFAEANSQFSK